MWVFPRGFGILPAWIGVTLLWLIMGERRRAYATVFGFLFLAWIGGHPLWGPMGLGLVVGMHFLFLASRWRLGVIFSLALAAVALGHLPVLLVSLPRETVLEGRMAAHVLVLFFGFRAMSYALAVMFRGDRPTFALTLEYFLSPPFLLEPGKGVQMTYATYSAPGSPLRWKGALWVGRGLLHAWLFWLVGSQCMELLQERYSLPQPTGLLWWAEVGGLAFVLGYLEKSRMSYLLAGLLCLSGRAVEPDFRAPWLAKSLLEYWRRFHSWVLDYWLELIWQPIAYFGWRWATAVALFFTFSVGTSVSHWIHYPAEATVAVGIGLLFALATLLHYGAVRTVRAWPYLWKFSWIGVGFTWITVMFLYSLAYPAFGLGWSAEKMMHFFGGSP